MSSIINRSVNQIVDYIYANDLKKNYLQGVTTMEELAAIKSDLARYAFDALGQIPGNHDRQRALQILSRIEI